MIRQISFDDFPNLNEHYKEQNGLGVYSFYLTKDNEYFLCWKNSCKCCYGERSDVFWILDLSGNILRQETEEFYKSQIKEVKEILKFQIPERLSKNYFRISTQK